MLTFFDFRTFFRIARRSFSHEVDDVVSLTPKRIVFLIAFFVLFPIGQLFTTLFLKLDDILYPDHKNTQIKEPVFIIGNPRSGTTHMHRLLALDTKRFYFFKTWEIIFPSICQKKILTALGRLDERLGSPGYRFILKREKMALTELGKVHPSGLFLPEECEFLLVHIFSSYNLLFLFPFKDEFNWFTHFDELLSAREKKRIMGFYVDCIKRHAYFKKHGGQFLSKSPGFSSKVESLFEFFPEGKVIFMARSPLEVVPSVFSLVQELYRSTLNITVTDQMLGDSYQMIKAFYDYPLARLDTKEDLSYFIANYDQLAQSPLSLISKLYRHFGYELRPEYQQQLNREDEKANRYVSKHFYSLGQFNLTPEQIFHDFKDIFDRFDFITK